LARDDGDGETPADIDVDGDGDADGVTWASCGTPDGVTIGAELPRATKPDTGPRAEPHAAATNTNAKAPRRRT